MYAISYYADAYLPKRAFSAHFNVGWWNYNEHGTVLFDYEKFFGTGNEGADGGQLTATKNSSDFRMALAFAYPTGLLDFRLEISGMLFLQEPDKFVYSAEEWAFITPSIRYRPVKWASMDLGVDFRVSPSERENTYGIPNASTSLDLPSNFPDWRVQLGLELDLNLASEGLTSEISYEQKRAQEKIEVFEAVVEEREKSASVQNEIDNLKKVRKEAEKEIEELKKILDEDQ
jgi:hypothetical protein